MQNDIRIPPHDGERAKRLPIQIGRCCEITATLVAGSPEYILGISQDTDDSLRNLIRKQNENCFCLMGTCHSNASWHQLSTQLPNLPMGVATLIIEGPKVTFRCNGNHINCNDITMTLPTGCSVPWILTCWKDTTIDVKFKIQDGKQSSAANVDIGQNLFEHRKFTDATIKCANQQLPVHRAVLACCSPVFDNMFDSGMLESLQGVIVIEDVEFAAVEAMVKYMYTKELPDASLFPQLYTLANMYMVQGLQLELGQKMLSQLDKNNVKECASVVRRHAVTGNEEARKLWEELVSAIHTDKQLVKILLEALIDSPPFVVLPAQ